MRPVLIDTNAYASFKRGDSSILKIIQYAEILAMSPIVIGELLSGFECGTRTKKKIEMNFKSFLSLQELKYSL